ncbi:hypothetical protein PV08_03312 [Exophiala spinifera]|uniref:Glycosyltransferase 2-like domain-containing protein n=1 Tax=Exophiala spinifera TaxID=91928 RepID=A0A0D2A290_9EURO|nr:uncharacterized protein PV08_03312 [Exophiala spinifera]KIW19022.1 hypothetical protein PV08_03312 [Exophiala spinifera]
MGNSISLQSSVAPAILLFFLVFDFFEHRTSLRNRARYRAFPIPEPSARKYHLSDVSVIIPTIDHEETFADCICSILLNKVREIIVVTTEAEAASVERFLLHNDCIRSLQGATEVQVLTVPAAQKRDQLVRGVNASRGSIVAFVDDDAYWPHDNVLIHLLAPFQDDDVGLSGGAVFSYIPEGRRNPDVISAWEVAAIRLRGQRHDSMQSAYAADRGINFCVSGVTMLFRGEIVRDRGFQQAFTNDYWMGVRQNTGDDGFLTRWVLFHHLLRPPQHQREGAKAVPQQWTLGIQLTPEAEVGTTLMRDSRFAGQVKRWYRSGLRHRLLCLLYEPGYRPMRQTCPFMARKMVEGMLNPVLVWLRLWAIYKTIRIVPQLAMLLLGWKTYNYVCGLLAFVKEYPFARRHLWAAILVDRLYLISDWYCWATLGKEAWLTRANVDGAIPENLEAGGTVDKED